MNWSGSLIARVSRIARARSLRALLPLFCVLLGSALALPLIVGCEGSSNHGDVPEGSYRVEFLNNSTTATHLWSGDASGIGPGNRLEHGGEYSSTELLPQGSDSIQLTAYAGRDGQVLASETVTVRSQSVVRVVWNGSASTFQVSVDTIR